MNIIDSPNLPEKNVKLALCDSRVEEDIIKEIDLLGCKVILVPQCEELQHPVNAHPDMNFLHYDKTTFYASDSLYNCDSFDEFRKHCEIFNNRVHVTKLSAGYPYDVLLNAAVIGDYVICNKRTVANAVANDSAKKIHVNQGYTKCSIAPVTKESFITDDIGIYNATKNIFDVCLVKRGEIKLIGYNYGFIGGTCGKISKDTIAFFGDLNKFSDKDKIVSFCRNYNVHCISLSKTELCDYGSLIPLFE